MDIAAPTARTQKWQPTDCSFSKLWEFIQPNLIHKTVCSGVTTSSYFKHPLLSFFFLGRLVWGLLYCITAHDFWSFIHVLCLGVTDSQRSRKNDNKCCFHSQYKTLPKGSVICNGKFLLLKILHKQIRHFILNMNQWVNLIIHTANPKSEWQRPRLSSAPPCPLSCHTWVEACPHNTHSLYCNWI